MQLWLKKYIFCPTRCIIKCKGVTLKVVDNDNITSILNATQSIQSFPILFFVWKHFFRYMYWFMKTKCKQTLVEALMLSKTTTSVPNGKIISISP